MLVLLPTGIDSAALRLHRTPTTRKAVAVPAAETLTMTRQQSPQFLARNLHRCCCWCGYFVSPVAVVAAGGTADQHHYWNHFGGGSADDGTDVDHFCRCDRDILRGIVGQIGATAKKTTAGCGSKSPNAERVVVPVPVVVAVVGSTKTTTTTTEKLLVADRKSRNSSGNATFSFAARRGS